MDKEEFKRLQRAENKAFKRKSKEALYDWGIQFEECINNKLNEMYEKKFKKELSYSIDCFVIAIMFTLHFGEKTKFGSKRLNEIMKDINTTVDMFRTGEYSPQEYKQMLLNDNIILDKILMEDKNDK